MPLRSLIRWRRPWKALDRFLPFYYPDFLDLRGAGFWEGLDRFIDNSVYLRDWLPPGSALMSLSYAGEKVRETEDSYILSVPMPGMDEDDIEISLEGRVLKVKAGRSSEEEEEEAGYRTRRRESFKYHWRRRFSHDVDEASVEPVYEKGILTVTVKKPEELIEEPAEVRRIPVRKA